MVSLVFDAFTSPNARGSSSVASKQQQHQLHSQQVRKLQNQQMPSMQQQQQDEGVTSLLPPFLYVSELSVCQEMLQAIAPPPPPPPPPSIRDATTVTVMAAPSAGAAAVDAPLPGAAGTALSRSSSLAERAGAASLGVVAGVAVRSAADTAAAAAEGASAAALDCGKTAAAADASGALAAAVTPIRGSGQAGTATAAVAAKAAAEHATITERQDSISGSGKASAPLAASAAAVADADADGIAVVQLGLGLNVLPRAAPAAIADEQLQQDALTPGLNGPWQSEPRACLQNSKGLGPSLDPVVHLNPQLAAAMGTGAVVGSPAGGSGGLTGMKGRRGTGVGGPQSQPQVPGFGGAAAATEVTGVAKLRRSSVDEGLGASGGVWGRFGGFGVGGRDSGMLATGKQQLRQQQHDQAGRQQEEGWVLGAALGSVGSCTEALFGSSPLFVHGGGGGLYSGLVAAAAAAASAGTGGAELKSGSDRALRVSPKCGGEDTAGGRGGLADGSGRATVGSGAATSETQGLLGHEDSSCVRVSDLISVFDKVSDGWRVNGGEARGSNGNSSSSSGVTADSTVGVSESKGGYNNVAATAAAATASADATGLMAVSRFGYAPCPKGSLKVDALVDAAIPPHMLLPDPEEVPGATSGDGSGYTSVRMYAQLEAVGSTTASSTGTKNCTNQMKSAGGNSSSNRMKKTSAFLSKSSCSLADAPAGPEDEQSPGSGTNREGGLPVTRALGATGVLPVPSAIASCWDGSSSKHGITREGVPQFATPFSTDSRGLVPEEAAQRGSSNKAAAVSKKVNGGAGVSIPAPPPGFGGVQTSVSKANVGVPAAATLGAAAVTEEAGARMGSDTAAELTVAGVTAAAPGASVGPRLAAVAGGGGGGRNGASTCGGLGAGTGVRSWVGGVSSSSNGKQSLTAVAVANDAGNGPVTGRGSTTNSNTAATRWGAWPRGEALLVSEAEPSTAGVPEYHRCSSGNADSSSSNGYPQESSTYPGTYSSNYPSGLTAPPPAPAPTRAKAAAAVDNRDSTDLPAAPPVKGTVTGAAAAAAVPSGLSSGGRFSRSDSGPGLCPPQNQQQQLQHGVAASPDADGIPSRRSSATGASAAAGAGQVLDVGCIASEDFELPFALLDDEFQLEGHESFGPTGPEGDRGVSEDKVGPGGRCGRSIDGGYCNWGGQHQHQQEQQRRYMGGEGVPLLEGQFSSAGQYSSSFNVAPSPGTFLWTPGPLMHPSSPWSNMHHPPPLPYNQHHYQQQQHPQQQQLMYQHHQQQQQRQQRQMFQYDYQQHMQLQQQQQQHEWMQQQQQQQQQQHHQHQQQQQLQQHRLQRAASDGGETLHGFNRVHRGVPGAPEPSASGAETRRHSYDVAAGDGLVQGVGDGPSPEQLQSPKQQLQQQQQQQLQQEGEREKHGEQQQHQRQQGPMRLGSQDVGSSGAADTTKGQMKKHAAATAAAATAAAANGSGAVTRAADGQGAGNSSSYGNAAAAGRDLNAAAVANIAIAAAAGGGDANGGSLASEGACYDHQHQQQHQQEQLDGRGKTGQESLEGNFISSNQVANGAAGCATPVTGCPSATAQQSAVMGEVVATTGVASTAGALGGDSSASAEAAADGAAAGGAAEGGREVTAGSGIGLPPVPPVRNWAAIAAKEPVAGAGTSPRMQGRAGKSGFFRLRAFPDAIVRCIRTSTNCCLTECFSLMESSHMHKVQGEFQDISAS